MACIPEEDLLELATGDRSLANAPALEAHLADCAACSGLLCTLIAPTPEPTRALVGTTLGPYRLDGLIGAGAMGEVYRARDLRLERNVAVKVLSRQLADSPDLIRRLEAEGRAAAGITHPNIVTVYDTGSHGGVPYVVSELITGETLRSMLDRGAIDRQLALALGLQLARGVAAAHAQGVVHRDLKPGNLIVTDDGTLKILDFGLAKIATARDVEATEPGTLLGTSGYLSPEQARGEAADARSDIFAIGAILYELLAGRRAFDGATFAERLSAVLRDAPPPLADPAWPIVARCVEKDPKKRFQSAGDLAWVLAEGPTASAKPVKARAMVSRRTFVAGAAATGALGVLLGRQLRRAPRAAFVPEVKQLSFGQGRVGRARFTSNGDSILYSALWDAAPATTYTTRLAGGGTRALQLPPSELLAISSRGQLALSLDHHYVEGFHQSGKLALAPLEGGTPRALGIDVQDADFTPDGDQLAIVRVANGRFRLELPAGKVLLEAGWLSNPRVSPDGKLVACLLHGGSNDNRGDVVVVPSAGGPARPISAGWSSIDGLAWTANGRALWISATREGGNSIAHAIGLDGRVRTQLPSVGRLRVHDLAKTGTLAVTHISGRLRLMARPAGARDEIDLGLSDVSLLRDISADGRFIASSELGDVDTASGVYLRATDGTTTQQLGAGVAFDIGPTGVLGTRGGPSLAVFPIDHGQPRKLEIAGLAQPRLARWCADDGVVVSATMGDRPRRLWRVDRAHRRATPLTAEGIDEPFVVSPGGRRLALIANDQLHIANISGESPQILDGFAGETVCGWASDREVYVRTKPVPIRVRKIDLETTDSTPVIEVMPPRLGLRGVSAFAISERGDAYAYSFGQELSRLYSMSTDTLD